MESLKQLVGLMEEWQLMLQEKARNAFHEAPSSTAVK